MKKELKPIISTLGSSKIYSNKTVRDLLKPKKRIDVSSDLIDIGYDEFYYKAVKLITKVSKYAINNVARKPKRSFIGWLTHERVEEDPYSGYEKLYGQLKLVQTYYENIEDVIKRIGEIEEELQEKFEKLDINNPYSATALLSQLKGLDLIKTSYLTLRWCYETVINSPDIKKFKQEYFYASMDLVYFGR